jgi:hypothetical protein
MHFNLSLNDFKLHHPFTMTVSGNTQAGKTHFIVRFIKNNEVLIDFEKNDIKKPGEKIIVLWCYKQKYPLINFPNVEVIYFNNFPDINDLKKFKPDLIVLDDLMNDVTPQICELFTIDSHALNISVIFAVQNLFNRNKFMRTISLNTHYFILMRGLRNESQVELLARQIFRNKSKQVLDIFRKVTEKPYSYLLLDLHPKSKREIAIRTRIFPEELETSLAQKHSFSPIYFNI